MKNLFIYAFICLLFTNCSSTYIVKYEEPEPDRITSPKLKTFLNSKEDIKVVLRTPSKADDLTKTNELNPIYNTIEKELLKAGFIVRDRAIFNQVVSKSAQEINYSELQEETDTDLIIELVDLNTKVPYTTNTYFSDGKKKTFQYDYNLTRYGAKAEFRVVLLKDNQFAGSYSFNYAPCPVGCPIRTNPNGSPRFVERNVNEELNDDPYQFISKSKLEGFMKSATERLISEMK